MLTKVCTKCGIEKTFSEFHKHKACNQGVRPECAECKALLDKEYREANKAAIAGQRKAYYEVNKESVAERYKAYREQNKESVSEYKKFHRKTNPHLYNANAAKRKATKLQATPSWANKEHIESLYLIASINREGGNDLHVDHIVPLQSNLVCGLHCEANLQLLPSSDNISKGNRHWPDMW